MGRKVTAETFQAINKRYFTPENLDSVKKERSLDRNLISSNMSTKLHHKDQRCKRKNKQDATK